MASTPSSSHRPPASGDAHFPEEHRYKPPDDEISLVELWLILARRRWWLFGIALAVLIAGSLYAAFQATEQAYTTTLRLATGASLVGEDDNRRLVGGEPLVSVQSLQNRFERVVLPRLKREFEAEYETGAPPIELERVEEAPTLMLVSTVPAYRAEDVERLHQRASDWLIEAQQEAFKREEQQQERTIERLSEDLEEERAAVNADLERAREELEEARGYLSEIREVRDRLGEQLDGEGSRDNGGTDGADGDEAASILQTRLEANREDFSLAQSEVRNLEERISELRSERRTMEWEFVREREMHQNQLERLQAPQAMEIAAAGAEQSSPANLIVALSAVLGLMLGVFGAFFREFLAHVQQVASGEA